MKKYISKTLFAGIILGILFWGGFNWSLELTNTEKFCISCHEKEETAFAEYKDTIHYNNRSGVRATCPDCHVPKEWVYKIKRKIEASTELYHEALGTINTPEKFEAQRLKMALREWKRMKSSQSRECRNCHAFQFMDLEEQDKSSRKKHSKAIKEGQTCIDCHKGIAHELPEDWKAAAKEAGL